MNTHERRTLWEQLLSARLVAGELAQETSSPWYIRVMLGIAGWIGALFILGFIGVGFEMVMRSSIAAAVVATACCSGAFFIFRSLPKGDFAGQFGLAIGLVGQILFGVAIFKEFNGTQAGGYALFFIVEATLTLLMPSFMHRIFTTIAAAGSLFICFAQAGLHGVALPLLAAGGAFVWRSELRLARRLELWHPVGYGLTLGLISMATISLTAGEKIFLHRNTGGWLLHHAAGVETTLVAGIFLAVTVTILRELEIEISGTAGIVILFCATFIMAASFPIHGLAVALLIMILGFSRGNRILLALGMLGFAAFMTVYYYQMQETLLYKSLMLGATGAFLLAARQGVRLMLPAREVRGHA